LLSNGLQGVVGDIFRINGDGCILIQVFHYSVFFRISSVI
jgi:hypothetical protein